MNDIAACMLSGWENKDRWKGVIRPYSPEDVLQLRGSLKIEYTVATVGANRLWTLLQENQSSVVDATSVEEVIQQVQIGSSFIQLFSPTHILGLVQEVEKVFRKAEQVEPGKWRIPIVANVGTEFSGSPFYMFEAIRELIILGASGICIDYEKRLKAKLITCRLAADVCGVPTVLIGRFGEYFPEDCKGYVDYFWTKAQTTKTISISPRSIEKNYHKNVMTILNRAVSDNV